MKAVIDNAFFAHVYDYTLLDERPGGAARIYYYPGGRMDGGRDGVLVRFQMPGSLSWIGMFAPGAYEGWATGLYTHPDARCILVVSHGAGYIVRVDEPTQWEAVDVDPIVDVVVALESRLLIFSTDISLVAYGSGGRVWETGRLALDELRITEVTAQAIHLHADRVDGPDVPVVVDMTTGIADILHPW